MNAPAHPTAMDRALAEMHRSAREIVGRWKAEGATAEQVRSRIGNWTVGIRTLTDEIAGKRP